MSATRGNVAQSKEQRKRAIGVSQESGRMAASPFPIGLKFEQPPTSPFLVTLQTGLMRKFRELMFIANMGLKFENYIREISGFFYHHPRRSQWVAQIFSGNHETSAECHFVPHESVS
jgi:hypothetical protein